MKKTICLTGIPSDLEKETTEILKILGIDLSPNGITVVLKEQGDGICIEKSDDTVYVLYSKRCEMFRALSLLPRFFEQNSKYTETARFTTLCYMADVSRNAVMSVKSVKRLLRYLAIMGFNSMMLYTEDVYEIPEYPYFGHMRGRYTHDELRELDLFAQKLGIELIPCIQTLAHLATALRWDTFKDICDTSNILLAEDERTYQFIKSMFDSVASCFSSRRINLGMDEAHMLGRGRYLDKNGYVPNHEIMLKHLSKVIDLCNQYGFKPMIWSDMFFRMAFDGKYYVSSGDISQDVISRIPPEVQLIYWDYYTTEADSDTFNHMLDSHLKFNNEIAFAGGVWKWYGFAPFNKFSIKTSRFHLKSCIQKGVREIMTTGWGDNGAEASQFSIIPSLVLYAESCYAENENDEWLSQRLIDCFGISLDKFLLLDLPNDLPGTEDMKKPSALCKIFLHNDPLNGLINAHIDPAMTQTAYAKNAALLKEGQQDTGDFSLSFITIQKLCHLLEKKAGLPVIIKDAYKKGDKEALLDIANNEIPETIARLNSFLISFREQWLFENKPFGFDTQEIRLGGMRERLNSTAMRLIAFCNGEIDCIEELEQPSLPFCENSINDKNLYLGGGGWSGVVTASII